MLYSSKAHSLEQVKELRLVSESASRGECWKHVPLSALLPLAHHVLLRLAWFEVTW